MARKDQNVDLRDEDEIVEGTHDMEKAEEQSVDSVAKTDDPVKQAPARKGDKRNSMPAPKTAAGKISAMYDKLKLLKKEDLDMAFETLMAEDFEVVSLEDFVSEDETVAEEVEYDFSDDIDALVEGEATLSEEFKQKTATIFEAAVRSKVAAEVDRLEEAFQENLNEEVEAIRTDLVEKVDSYLNYVVETWLENNELAVEQGLRTEIAEGFMSNLRDLFVESYIEVPETKLDLVDELSEQVEDLEGRLNLSTENAIAMSEELEAYRRDEVIREHATGLADTQFEKLVSLVDSVDYEDRDSFSAKVKTIKESYFTKKASADGDVDSLTEATDDGDVTLTEATPQMDRYISAIRNSSRKV